MDTPLMLSNDPDVQQRTSAMQGDLIHTFWGYHSHRVRNGFSFALGNPVRDAISTKINEEADASNRGSPAAFVRSVQETGHQDFNLIDSIKSSPDQTPIAIIANGIIASMWDSLNHVTGFFTENAPSEYADFIIDDELRKLKEEMNALGKNQSSFNGSGKLHAGARVGVETMTFLAGIEYGLPSGHPFDTKDIAYMLSKTDMFQLGLWEMDQTMLSFVPTVKQLSNFHDPEAPVGFPVDRLQKHCVPDALGCSARGKIGDTATAILKRHGLYSPTYDDAEKQSAIKLIAGEVKDFFSQQMNVLLGELTDEEQSTHICKRDRLMLQGIEAQEENS